MLSSSYNYIVDGSCVFLVAMVRGHEFYSCSPSGPIHTGASSTFPFSDLPLKFLFLIYIPALDIYCSL